MTIQEKLCNKLDKLGYTDKVDTGTDISLFEYGIIRNPKTHDTIFGYSDNGEICNRFDSFPVSLEDVIAALERAEYGFYSFIDQSKEEVLKGLSNEYLSDIIRSLNSYNGWFYPECYWKESPKELLESFKS